jgi:hypothetical protein
VITEFLPPEPLGIGSPANPTSSGRLINSKAGITPIARVYIPSDDQAARQPQPPMTHWATSGMAARPVPWVPIKMANANGLLLINQLLIAVEGANSRGAAKQARPGTNRP